MSKTSIIPAGVTLEGEIEGRGDLVVAGIVEGPIDIEGTLLIEEGAQVRGDVSATSVRVCGVVAGTVSATETVVVEPSAIVVGDARAARVQIVDGARFRGRVQMSGEPAPRRRRRPSRAEASEASVRDTVVGTLSAPSIEPEPPAARSQRRDAVQLATAESESTESAATESTESAATDTGRSRKRRRGRRRSRRRGADSEAGEGARVDSSAPPRSDPPRRTRRRREPEPSAPKPSNEPVARETSAPSEPTRRRPPPPRIPTVSRQKARRKDRGEAGS